MKCAVYVRVSTEMEVQKTSIAHQINFFESYIQKKGWQLYRIYKDIESGRSIKNRNGLQELLKDAKGLKFDAVLTKSISRFARNTLEGLSMIRDFKYQGIRFISIEDGFDSEEYDEFMLTLFLSLAQKESEKISERVRFGKWCRAKMGIYNGSLPPYGYRKGPENKLIPADDASVYVVRKIFKMYIEGNGFYKIAQELNRCGYPTPSQTAGKRNSSPVWHQSTIRNILTNPVYIGNLVQNKTEVQNSGKGQRKKNDESHWIYAEASHPGIIDVQIFEEVQKLIEKKKQKRMPASKNLFSDLLICGECGSSMHYKKGKRAYICGKVNKMGKEFCRGSYIQEKHLKEIVRSELKNLINVQISEQDILEKIVMQKKEGDHAMDIELNEKYLQELMRRKERLADVWMKGKIDEEVYSRKLKEIQAEGELIRKEKERMTKIYQCQEQNLRDWIQKILNIEIINEVVLKALISQIQIFREKKIEIRYAFQTKSINCPKINT